MTPKGRIQVSEGSRFYPGTRFMGFDLARWLDERLDVGARGTVSTRSADFRL